GRLPHPGRQHRGPQPRAQGCAVHVAAHPRLLRRDRSGGNAVVMSRRLLWSLLLIIAAIAFAVVLVPALVIQPFRPQSPRGLEVSFFLKRIAPIATIAALLGCIALVVKLWRGARWSRVLLIILLILPTLSA